jgi:hypothetical protein
MASSPPRLKCFSMNTGPLRVVLWVRNGSWSEHGRFFVHNACRFFGESSLFRQIPKFAEPGNSQKISVIYVDKAFPEENPGTCA